MEELLKVANYNIDMQKVIVLQHTKTIKHNGRITFIVTMK